MGDQKTHLRLMSIHRDSEILGKTVRARASVQQNHVFIMISPACCLRCILMNPMSLSTCISISCLVSNQATGRIRFCCSQCLFSTRSRWQLQIVPWNGFSLQFIFKRVLFSSVMNETKRDFRRWNLKASKWSRVWEFYKKLTAGLD